jgi:hypothetical protein
MHGYTTVLSIFQIVEHDVFAEELVVLDGDSPLFRPLRPLLDAALRLEQQDESYSWHGWNKQQIQAFLASLPSSCSLVVGVWKTIPADDERPEREQLVLGCVCEVREGAVYSIRTFDALEMAGLKPADHLEPGIDDALEIMRAARTLTSVVAWALFIEKTAWDEWLFASGDDGAVIDKGELLASYARQGRCVLMGSRTAHH